MGEVMRDEGDGTVGTSGRAGAVVEKGRKGSAGAGRRRAARGGSRDAGGGAISEGTRVVEVYAATRDLEWGGLGPALRHAPLGAGDALVHYMTVVRTVDGRMLCYDFGPGGGGDTCVKSRAGEIRETEIDALPANHLLIGYADADLGEVRSFNRDLHAAAAGGRLEYRVNSYDCRHYTNRLISHLVDVDCATGLICRQQLQGDTRCPVDVRRERRKQRRRERAARDRLRGAGEYVAEGSSGTGAGAGALMDGLRGLGSVGRLAQGAYRTAYDAVADLRHRCEDTVRSYISAGTFDGSRIGEAAARLEARLGVQDSQVMRGTLNFLESSARSTKDFVVAKVEGLGFAWLKAPNGGDALRRRSPPVALSLSSAGGGQAGGMRRSGSGPLLTAPGEDFFLEKPGGRKTFDKSSFQRRPPRPPHTRLQGRAGTKPPKDTAANPHRLLPKAKSVGDLAATSSDRAPSGPLLN